MNELHETIHLSKYQILGKVGVGGGGTVYQARHHITRQVRALKILPPIGLDAEGRRRFEREARIMAGLRHPHIVTLYDAAVEQGFPYLDMEFIDGLDVGQMLEAATAAGLRGLPPVEVARLAAQMAEALDHLHGQPEKPIHRDVKPSNIIRREADGHYLLTDFGIAFEAQYTRKKPSEVMGTPEYMSPEQVDGQALDRRTDQYSLAVVLYEALAGTPPFALPPSATLTQRMQVLDQILRTPPPDLPPDLPPGLNAVLQRALRKQPEDRYPDCRSLALAFTEALQDAGLAPDLTAPFRAPWLEGHRPTEPAVAAPAVTPAPPTANPEPAPASGTVTQPVLPAPPPPASVPPTPVPPTTSPARYLWPLVVLVLGAAGLLSIRPLVQEYFDNENRKQQQEERNSILLRADQMFGNEQFTDALQLYRQAVSMGADPSQTKIDLCQRMIAADSAFNVGWYDLAIKRYAPLRSENNYAARQHEEADARLQNLLDEAARFAYTYEEARTNRNLAGLYAEKVFLDTQERSAQEAINEILSVFDRYEAFVYEVIDQPQASAHPDLNRYRVYFIEQFRGRDKDYTTGFWGNREYTCYSFQANKRLTLKWENGRFAITSDIGEPVGEPIKGPCS